MTRPVHSRSDGRRPRVLIVDDHQLLAHGVALALGGRDFVIEVTEPSVRDVVERARRLQPDVVLLDLVLWDGFSGLDLIEPLRLVGDARIVMLTGVTDPIELARCVEAGADGLASKRDDFDVIIESVVRAARGEPLLSDHHRTELLLSLRAHRQEERERLARFDELTRREQEILAALMDGQSPQEIADNSYVSLGTVRSQIKAIRIKLGVSSQLEAATTAIKAGWSLELTSVA